MSDDEVDIKKKQPERGSIVPVFMWVITIALMAWFGFAFFNFLENSIVTNVTQSMETTNTSIVSLHDGSGASGHFFLGSGSISEEGYYVYYVNTGNSSYRRRTVKSDYTEIVMDEEKSPHIREFTIMETTCTRVGCDTSPMGYRTFRGAGDGWYLGYKKWELHVPNGTLVREMEVGHA